MSKVSAVDFATLLRRYRRRSGFTQLVDGVEADVMLCHTPSIAQDLVPHRQLRQLWDRSDRDVGTVSFTPSYGGGGAGLVQRPCLSCSDHGGGISGKRHQRAHHVTGQPHLLRARTHLVSVVVKPKGAK